MTSLDLTLDLIDRTVNGLMARADRFPVPRTAQGQVVSYDRDSGLVTFTLDEDPSGVAVTAASVTPWAYAPGTRIQVLQQPAGGNLVLGPTFQPAADQTLIVTSTTRPTVGLAAGRTVIYETDTGRTLRWYSSVTGWQPADWGAAWGELARVVKTAAQNTITTVDDVTSLTGLSWAAVQNRKYRVSLKLPVLTQNTAAGTVLVVITDNANTRTAQDNWAWAAGLGGAAHVIEDLDYSAAATTLTRKGRISTNAGSVSITCAADVRGFLCVDDVGPLGPPA